MIQKEKILPAPIIPQDRSGQPPGGPIPINPPPDQPEEGREIRVTPDRISSQR